MITLVVGVIAVMLSIQIECIEAQLFPQPYGLSSKQNGQGRLHYMMQGPQHQDADREVQRAETHHWPPHRPPGGFRSISRLSSSQGLSHHATATRHHRVNLATKNSPQALRLARLNAYKQSGGHHAGIKQRFGRLRVHGQPPSRGRPVAWKESQ